MAKNNDNDVRKLRQTDPDKIVHNTIQNETNKKMSKMDSFEKVTLAGDAIDEEINIAVDEGKMDLRQAAEVKESMHNKKKFKKMEKGDSVASQFTRAMTFFAPQIIGTAVGALFGGTDGAVAGGEAGAKAGDAIRTFERQTEQDDLNEETKVHQMEMDHLKYERQLEMDKENSDIKRTDQALRSRKLDADATKRDMFKKDSNVVHKMTGEALSFKDGRYYNQKGEVVPANLQKNLANESLEHRKNRGDTLSGQFYTKEGRMREQFGHKKKEDAEKDRVGLLNSFEKDPIVVQTRKGLAMIEPAITALNSGSPMAPGMAQAAMARLSGEVGALTDTDLTRYGGKQDIVEKIKRIKTKQVSGVPLTDRDKKDFLFMLKSMKEINERRLGKIKQRKIKGYNAATDDVSISKGNEILDVPDFKPLSKAEYQSLSPRKRLEYKRALKKRGN